jgi:hypothetical protein
LEDPEMSAIVAGTCRQCGEQFWISLGHPPWLKAFLKTGKPTEEARRFAELQRKQVCIECAPEDYVAIFGADAEAIRRELQGGKP